MVLPNFLILGAMKAGTSWLSANLNQHPDIFLPKHELHFFNNQNNFSKGRSWYESQFEPGIGKRAIGEKTPDYLLCRREPSFYQEYLPGIKIIVVLRNPVARIVSQINHHIRHGEITPLLARENLVGSPEFSEIDQKFALLERSEYYPQVKAFYECFGPENTMIIINEVDICEKPQDLLQKVCMFLEVDPDFEFQHLNKKIHQSRNTQLGVMLAYRLPGLRTIICKLDRVFPGKKVLPFQFGENDAHWLYKYYQDKNKDLFSFLKRDLPDSWLPQ